MIRLFISHDLAAGAEVSASAEQSHYLAHVMRARIGEEILLFNGRDGEWAAKIRLLGRHEARLVVSRRARPQSRSPDLELLAAVVKRGALETIVEKAAELGVRRIRLLLTARTDVSRAGIKRLNAIAIEAVEQTGRLDALEIAEPVKFADVLAAWPGERSLMFCDEAGDAPPALQALAMAADGPWAILIGPEGGFTPEERAAARAARGVVPVSLGPRILRADTAAIAALSLWQATRGDWRGA